MTSYLLFAGYTYYADRPSGSFKGVYTSLEKAIKVGTGMVNGGAIIIPGEGGEAIYWDFEWFDILDSEGNVVCSEGYAHGDD